MITKAFRVASCAAGPVKVMAQVGDDTVEATVRGLVLELIALDDSGSLTIRTPMGDDEAATAVADFERDATVVATFTRSA